MNKLQPSPLFNTRGMPLRQSIAPWGAPPLSLEDTRFFRSWLVYDSDLETNRTRGRLNWNLIAGAALMMVVSAAGWAGIAWLVAQIWK
ncbi:MAG: hypothetical protein WB562_08530 [Candidatus Sulfotelmatobacter sp.]